ncbi:acyltransferase family protein [Sphingomonas koreensis]|uniref:Acyltransferase n=1 Tax=Sphingomonas koreensis TaxID=93064 RepID=A0A1L6JBZ2_9SPHN|nr:acyltransferase [Sphingomonas koreensis]APR53454.1 acyltransferase [Sphingomonas koreensis]MDC7809853.1 acyltransferase [Sphingomonas koreensis]
MARADAAPASVTAPAKNHYVILDGLRGVAALMVLLMHLFEGHTGGDLHKMIINHGYLAVDFFFLLSGFVVAYAYDDRWGGMTQWEFYKRRLVRLQPMVIFGSIVGAALFVFQIDPFYPLAAGASLWQVLMLMGIGFTLIPVPPSMDVRGWGETFPLNGPAWSLFFEYCANILYAAGLYKLSNRWLGLLVAIAGAALFHLAVFGERGDLVGGWTLTGEGVYIGFVRLLFPFFAGVLMMRLGMRIRMKGAFWASSLLLIVALSLPRFGGTANLWMNGLYEALCVLVIFPLVVAIGAGQQQMDGVSLRIARFFGDLSYPLYITHYPLVYIYMAWIVTDKPSTGAAILGGVAVAAASIALAYASLRLYDLPVRRWLGKRLLSRNA